MCSSGVVKQNKLYKPNRSSDFVQYSVLSLPPPPPPPRVQHVSPGSGYSARLYDQSKGLIDLRSNTPNNIDYVHSVGQYV